MNTPSHILIIRLSAMGDVAMSVPVIKALLKEHPSVKVTMLSKSFLKPLFKDIPNVTFYAAEVTSIHKGVSGLYTLFKALKKTNITHVADFHNVLRSKILRSFFSFYGYKTASIDKGRKEKKALTRSVNKIFKPLKTSHQRYADVLALLGFKTDITLFDKKTTPKLSDKTIRLTGEKKTIWIGIAPFAAFDSKVYPLDLMENVIKELSKNYSIFLFGGKADREILTSLEKKHPNSKSIAGLLSLELELELIDNLDVMLAMDSGNAHFSAMQQIPTVTLWGATHPYAGFAPFMQPLDNCIVPNVKQYPNLPCSVYGNKICEGYEDVMRSISPEDVIKKVISLIKK